MNSVAVFLRNRSFCIVFTVGASVKGAYGIERQLSCLVADHSRGYPCRHREARVLKSLVNAAHSLPPYGLGEVCLIPRFEVHVIVKAGPGSAGIVRGIAGEPDVVFVGGGSGLTGYGHSVKSDPSSGTLCNNILHGAGQEPRGGGL